MKVSKGVRLVVLGLALVVIDQLIKVLVKTDMCLGEQFNVFGDWCRILFVENEGMAFGMRFGGRVGKFLLSLLRIVLCTGLCVWIASLVKKSVDEEGRQVLRADGRPLVPTGVLVGLTMITAGAFGNIIDCLFYGLLFSESGYDTVAVFGGHYAPFMFGKVVDMFYFPLIDTVLPEFLPFVGGKAFRFFEPVFNFADSLVSVGAFYLLLFHYRFFSQE